MKKSKRIQRLKADRRRLVQQLEDYRAFALECNAQYRELWHVIGSHVPFETRRIIVEDETKRADVRREEAKRGAARWKEIAALPFHVWQERETAWRGKTGT